MECLCNGPGAYHISAGVDAGRTRLANGFVPSGLCYPGRDNWFYFYGRADNQSRSVYENGPVGAKPISVLEPFISRLAFRSQYVGYHFLIAKLVVLTDRWLALLRDILAR